MGLLGRPKKARSLIDDLKQLYRKYSNGATERGLEFKLPVEAFEKLVLSECHYCGAEPCTNYRYGNGFLPHQFNGIDRLDSNLGYVVENCVTCCAICNRAKRDMSYSEFKGWIANLILHCTGR